MEEGKRMEVKEENQRISGNLPSLNSRKVLELTIFGKYFGIKKKQQTGCLD